MPLINVTIPVFNEEHCLFQNGKTLLEFCQNHLPFDFEIVIVDNGSTDNTLTIALRLQKCFPTIKVLRINQKGRGSALKHAWSQTSADVLSYMDCDLSTDLIHLDEL